jgi:hypothetical protein
VEFARRKLNGSTTLLTITTRVVGTLEMVFTNPIMTTHVNRIIDQPQMSSTAIGRYKSVDVTNLRGGYQEPYVIIAPILDNRNGHYVRPNRVALKYRDFKKMLIHMLMLKCSIL